MDDSAGDHSADRAFDVRGVRLVAKVEVEGVALEACDLGDVAVLDVIKLVPELDRDALEGFLARPRPGSDGGAVPNGGGRGAAPGSLSRGDPDAKAPPPPLAIFKYWAELELELILSQMAQKPMLRAAAALSAGILGMNPTWAELSVCARAQVAVWYEVNGRGRYRLLSHNMVLLNAQPAADSLPRECFNLQLVTQKQEVDHQTKTGSRSSHT